jgi:hypothetical protein
MATLVQYIEELLSYIDKINLYIATLVSYTDGMVSYIVTISINWFKHMYLKARLRHKF